MKCKSCGAELSSDSKFCSFCGEELSIAEEPVTESEYEEIVEDTSEASKEIKAEYHAPAPNNAVKSVNTSGKKSGDFADDVKAKATDIWSGLDLFEKIFAVFAAIALIACIWAFGNEKVLLGIIALAQIALLTAAFLIKREVITVKNTKIFIALFSAAAVLIIPFLGIDGAYVEKYDWDDVILNDVIPKPDSRAGEIISNSDDHLQLRVNRIKSEQFRDYIKSCKDSGFTVETEQSDNSFDAFNSDGYNLNLWFDKSNKKLRITLDAPKEFVTFKWPISNLARIVPETKSLTGEVEQNSDNYLKIYVADTSLSDFNEYVELCSDSGFNINAITSKKSYSAEYKNGCTLSVEYKGNNVIFIDAYAPDDAVFDDAEYDYNSAEEIEAALNSGKDIKGKIVKFVVNEYKPDSAIGINCWAGEHLNFISENELDVKAGDIIVGRVTKSATQTLGGSWKIPYQVISIGDEPVSAEVEKGPSENEAKMPKDSSDYIGKNYKNVVADLKKFGFTNIKVKADYDVVLGFLNSSGDTEKVRIEGETFEKGDIFAKDAKIVVTYHEDYSKDPSREEKSEKTSDKESTVNKEPNGIVSYSTNDKSTVKNGNTGIYSYKSNGSKNADGGWYDIYYIVNFDEGYVYYFCEGYGTEKGAHETCDRIKIDSGTLNDVVVITYHDGQDAWSEGLHFKWKNQPDHLVVEDHNGFEYDFYTTNLEDALEICDDKAIHDY